jgi:hypothetical protein
MSKQTANASSAQRTQTAFTPRGADLLIVDCLLPGQVRKLGRMVHSTPRRPRKTTAMNCEIRGGEYVAYDRSNYATALSVWLEKAEYGDVVAQNHVGEISETTPFFARALIDTLESNQEVLEASRLHTKIGALVAYTSSEMGFEQVPQYAANLHAGHIGGDFLFVPTKFQ